jgi:hypothetical protein
LRLGGVGISLELNSRRQIGGHPEKFTLNILQ